MEIDIPDDYGAYMPEVVRIQKEGNPIWPLPASYPELSPEEQRVARVNACRQWMLPGLTPQERGELLVVSVNAFDRLYLQQPQGMFYPPFLLVDSPKFHDDIISSIGRYKYNLIAAPRGHAKTFLMRKIVITLLTTCPMYTITYCTASTQLVKKTMASLVRVWRKNQAIFNDWAPEYGGKIVPSRGGAPFGFSGELHLANNSILYGTSAESRNRGDRPHLYIMDDIEVDYSKSTNEEQRREEVTELIFQIILPMVAQGDSKLVWVGTTISRKHMLWKACASDMDGRVIDPRFKKWRRILFKALYTDPATGKLLSLWPERFSVERLEDLKQEMGESAFRSELMNDPASAEDRAFYLDEIKHNWYLKDRDQQYETDPWTSRASICYQDAEGVDRQTPLPEFLKSCLLVGCVDWALTTTENSDYSAVAIMGLTPLNELFVLDIWAGKVTGSTLSIQTLKMARRWRPIAIGVEAPNISFHLAHAIKTKFQEASMEDGYSPKVEPVKTFKDNKQDRIEGLQWRFGVRGDASSTGLIKFPMRYREVQPWKMLFQQIEEFRPTAADGGLEHDDIIDAISMAQSLIPGLPQSKRKPEKSQKTDIQRLMAGEQYDEFGQPLIRGFEIGKLPKHILDAIIVARQENPSKPPKEITYDDLEEKASDGFEHTNESLF